jgi:hypothetical protein
MSAEQKDDVEFSAFLCHTPWKGVVDAFKRGHLCRFWFRVIYTLLLALAWQAAPADSYHAAAAGVQVIY